jgi:RNA polymerase sigma factor (sigma-70 family)
VAEAQPVGSEVGPRRGGSDREFEEFFDRAWPRARAMGVRMGLGREEAEDVALDALAVAYDQWGRVRDLGYRDAWVFKVTANMALRRLKKRHRPVLAPMVWAASPKDEVTSRLALRGVVAGLPRRQRQVLVLRYLADLPEEDVARALGINIGSVKQHASRGRAALRGTVAAMDRGAEDGR